MDPHLEKLRTSLLSTVEGMSEEQLHWHPPGKWCAAEVLEHLYLSYTGTIGGLERVLRHGKPLATQTPLRRRLLRYVVVGIGYIPTGIKAPAIVAPKGLPMEMVRNEIGPMMAAMDETIARCEAQFGSRIQLLDHPVLGPLTATQWRKLHLTHGRHHLKQVLRLREGATRQSI
jgi:DinB family protein